LVNIGLLYSIVVNQNSLHITNKITVVFVQDYMDFVNEGEFACHAKLNPAPTMTVCLPHYPYKYATYP
jgi:hypothetical protein